MASNSGLSGGIDLSGGPGTSGPQGDKTFSQQADNYLNGLGWVGGAGTPAGGYNPLAPAKDWEDPKAYARISDLQQRLFFAGYIPATANIYQGQADPLTRIALARAYKDATSLGFSNVDDYLTSKMQEGTKGSGGSKRAPYIPPTNRPLDDKVVNLGITDAFQTEFGRAPTDKELNSFRASFKARENQYFSQEDQAAQARYNAGVDSAYQSPTNDSGAGVSVGRLPSPTQLTEGTIQNTTESQGYRAATAGLKLLELMRGGG